MSRGLVEAFGTAEMDEIREVAGGLSGDLTYRMVVRGTGYLLKVMTRMDERNDPGRIFGAMRTAAEGGVAPRVWYASVEDGVSITDFVEAVRFPVGEARVQMPETLRRLHALPQFPKAFNWVTAHRGFIWRFRTAGLMPAGEVEEVFAGYEAICRVYPKVEEDMVSCHSDLKPENVLFDGERVWLVDWQAAFVNDRYFDLAVVANFLVGDEAEEREFLGRYLGAEAGEYERARFYLMRQVLHVFYATVFLLLGAGGKAVDLSERAGRFEDFHARIWGGEVNLADLGMRVAYGRVHWERVLGNLRGARFSAALGVVSARDGGAGRLLPIEE